jgi:hypothetical protein
MDPIFTGNSHVVFPLGFELFTLAMLQHFIGGLALAATLALAKNSPQIMRLMKGYLLGQNILILGTPIAGKTSFLNYLRYGTLPNTGAPPTKTFVPYDSLPFARNKQGAYDINIKRGMDVPGDTDIKSQLERLTARKPEILLVFISIAPVANRKKPYQDNKHSENIKLWDAQSKWLLSFANELKSILVGDESLRRKLKAILFILNREDLLEPSTMAARHQQVSKALEIALKPALGKNFERIEVINCSLYDQASADEVVIRLFHALCQKKSFN